MFIFIADILLSYDRINFTIFSIGCHIIISKKYLFPDKFIPKYLVELVT